MKNIPDGSIDCVITDPPYGTTACKWDTIIPFEPMWAELKRIIKPNGAIVLFGSEPFSSLLRMSNLKMYKYDWIWEKHKGTGHLLSKKQPLKSHEIVSVFYDKHCLYNPQMRSGFSPYVYKSGRQSENYGDQVSVVSESNGERYPISNIYFRTDKQKLAIHPTQKPVQLLEYLVKTYTNEGETVLDFTMGSGTTGVACKNLNRNFIGIEMGEEYFNIAKKRINETELRGIETEV